MSEFSDLKAEYIRLAGRNPAPMSAAKLAEKVAELRAAGGGEAGQPHAAEQPTGEGTAPSAGGDPVPGPASLLDVPSVAAVFPPATNARDDDREPATPGVEALFGSDTLPSTIVLTPSVSVQLGDVVRHAFEASGLSVDEFNNQHPTHREEQLQASIAQLRAEAELAEQNEGAASLEAELGALGLTADAGGDVEIEMLTGLSGPDICLVNGDPHRCPAAEAVRFVRAGAAKPRG